MIRRGASLSLRMTLFFRIRYQDQTPTPGKERISRIRKNTTRKDRCHSEGGARVILHRRGEQERRPKNLVGQRCSLSSGLLAQKVVTDRAVRPSTRFFGRRTGGGGTRMIRRGASLSLRMTLFFRIRYQDQTPTPGKERISRIRKNTTRKDRCHSEGGARVILHRRGEQERRPKNLVGQRCSLSSGLLAQKVVTDRAVRPSTRFFGRRTGGSGTRMIRRGASLRMTRFFRIWYECCRSQRESRLRQREPASSF